MLFLFIGQLFLLLSCAWCDSDSAGYATVILNQPYASFSVRGVGSSIAKALEIEESRVAISSYSSYPPYPMKNVEFSCTQEVGSSFYPVCTMFALIIGDELDSYGGVLVRRLDSYSNLNKTYLAGFGLDIVDMSFSRPVRPASAPQSSVSTPSIIVVILFSAVLGAACLFICCSCLLNIHLTTKRFVMRNLRRLKPKKTKTLEALLAPLDESSSDEGLENSSNVELEAFGSSSRSSDEPSTSSRSDDSLSE